MCLLKIERQGEIQVCLNSVAGGVSVIGIYSCVKVWSLKLRLSVTFSFQYWNILVRLWKVGIQNVLQVFSNIQFMKQQAKKNTKKIFHTCRCVTTGCLDSHLAESLNLVWSQASLKCSCSTPIFLFPREVKTQYITIIYFTCSSSSGVKSFFMLKVFLISSGVFPGLRTEIVFSYSCFQFLKTVEVAGATELWSRSAQEPQATNVWLWMTGKTAYKW